MSARVRPAAFTAPSRASVTCWTTGTAGRRPGVGSSWWPTVRPVTSATAARIRYGFTSSAAAYAAAGFTAYSWAPGPGRPSVVPVARTSPAASRRARSWDAVGFDRPVSLPVRVRDSGPCSSRRSRAARSFMARRTRGVPGVPAIPAMGCATCPSSTARLLSGPRGTSIRERLSGRFPVGWEDGRPGAQEASRGGPDMAEGRRPGGPGRRPSAVVAVTSWCSGPAAGTRPSTAGRPSWRTRTARPHRPPDPRPGRPPWPWRLRRYGCRSRRRRA